MNASAVANSCPACRDGATTQREAYGYAKSRLCLSHRDQFDEADRRAHAGGTCPWMPAGLRALRNEGGCMKSHCRCGSRLVLGVCSGSFACIGLAMLVFACLFFWGSK